MCRLPHLLGLPHHAVGRVGLELAPREATFFRRRIGNLHQPPHLQPARFMFVKRARNPNDDVAFLDEARNPCPVIFLIEVRRGHAVPLTIGQVVQYFFFVVVQIHAFGVSLVSISRYRSASPRSSRRTCQSSSSGRCAPASTGISRCANV